jgi:hypothetical protein
MSSDAAAGLPSTFDVTHGMDVVMLAPTIAVASGRVVDLATGDPIGGATVRYEPVDNGRRTPTATTNVDGYYSMRGLDYKEYHVRVSARRYIPGYVGSEYLLYPAGEASTWPGGQFPGDIKMARR